MGTVGAIIYDFTNKFAESLIFIQGSNITRTRLYQININKHWELIKPIFEVLGRLNDEWEPIKKGVNYDAFLGYRKHS
jgi:flagellin-specific chaperone FliS